MRGLLIALLLSGPALAKAPQVGQRDTDGALIVSVGNQPKAVQAVSAAQTHAQREANLMASRLRMGHLLGVAPGARFSGVGMGLTPNCRTCTPRRGMTLIADAVARGRNGYYYRSRHWR